MTRRIEWERIPRGYRVIISDDEISPLYQWLEMQNGLQQMVATTPWQHGQLLQNHLGAIWGYAGLGVPINPLDRLLP